MENPSSAPHPEEKTVDPQQQLRKITNIVYLLQALSVLIGLTSIAGIIINYIKRDETKGTLFESHFRWQIRTFWFTLLWVAIGFITTFIGIGIVILIAASIWFIYRVIKGWLYLNDNKPMYAEEAAVSKAKSEK